VNVTRFRRCTLEVAEGRYDEAVDALLGLGLRGWQERLPVLTFWLSDEAYASDACSRALEGLRALGRLYCEREEGGWERQWREFHHPVTTGNVTVRPPWAPPLPGTLDVIIDVGMAFGTGSHASTRQCLAVLAALPPSSLLDAGTGTGVLALAAMRLDFAPVFAFDSDPDALVIAEENARRNRLWPLLFGADATDPAIELPHAEVVVANIAATPIVALGRRYSAALAAGDEHPRLVIAAGLIEEQLPAVLAAFGGYRRSESMSEGEWHCVVLEAPALGESRSGEPQPDESLSGESQPGVPDP
jgi:ribosomal protein L11 methyltransferase